MKITADPTILNHQFMVKRKMQHFKPFLFDYMRKINGDLITLAASNLNANFELKFPLKEVCAVRQDKL